MLLFVFSQKAPQFKAWYHRNWWHLPKLKGNLNSAPSVVTTGISRSSWRFAFVLRVMGLHWWVGCFEYMEYDLNISYYAYKHGNNIERGRWKQWISEPCFIKSVTGARKKMLWKYFQLFMKYFHFLLQYCIIHWVIYVVQLSRQVFVNSLAPNLNEILDLKFSNRF